MTDIYTVGVWTVKPGREADFIAAWKAMADETIGEFPAARGILLQEVNNPSRFVSFGPWESQEEVDAWRASSAFGESVARMREFLEDFEPGTYELTAELAGPASR